MGSAFLCIPCGAAIVPEDVDLFQGRVYCRVCGTVSRSATPPIAAEAREIPALPPGMSARETPDRLFIAVRWFHPRHLAWIAVVAAGDALLFVMLRNLKATWVTWVDVLVAPMVYNTLAILGSYAALAVLLNRTHIHVSKARLRAFHVPVPCYAFRSMPAADVEQIFTRAEALDKPGGYRFHVCVRGRDGRWFTLVRKLRRLDQAIFIERAVERHLGIPDEPVAGEVPR